MRVRYEIDKDTNITSITFDGAVDDQTLIAQVMKVADDPDLGASTNMLHDYRHVTEFQVTPSGMYAVQNMMSHLSGFETSRKLALVAPRALARRLAWMCYELRTECPEGVAIFQDVREAQHWLEV